MTEDKANYASLPCAFQHNVVNTFAVGAVVPLRQITCGVCAGRRTTHLDVTNAAATFKPSPIQTVSKLSSPTLDYKRGGK